MSKLKTKIKFTVTVTHVHMRTTIHGKLLPTSYYLYYYIHHIKIYSYITVLKLIIVAGAIVYYIGIRIQNYSVGLDVGGGARPKLRYRKTRLTVGILPIFFFFES